MNSTELKNFILLNIKKEDYIEDAWFVINYGPAHFFKFNINGKELYLYFNLRENVTIELLKERISRKLNSN